MMKTVLFSIAFSLTTMIILYMLYCLNHFGFGKVAVPDWHTGYDNKGYPVPFPVTKAVEYWSDKGLLFALKCGAVTFIGTLLFTLIKSKLHLNYKG